MSGELLLKNHSWRQVLPGLLLAAAAAAGVTFWALQYLPLEGLAQAAVAALIAYVLFRVLYPVCTGLFSKGQTASAGTWRVTEDTLYLNDTAIPRSSIRQVHCWPNRDALGPRRRRLDGEHRDHREKPPAPYPDRGGGRGPLHPAAAGHGGGAGLRQPVDGRRIKTDFERS